MIAQLSAILRGIRSQSGLFRGRAVLMAAACLLLVACSGKSLSASHAKRGLEPGGFAQAATGPTWDVAAVRATSGTGLQDYTGTKLLPVLLIFKNKGPDQPQVYLEDVRGVASDGEYLVYSTDEAYRLASARSFQPDYGRTASNAAWGAAVGAAVGAGAGTLAYLLGAHQGANLIWQGALVGGGLGALTGTVNTGWKGAQETRDTIRADLNANCWQEDPIPVGTTRMGYLLLPEGVGIQSVRITVRDDAGSQVRDLSIAEAKDYDSSRARAMASAAGSEAEVPPKRAAPVADTVPDLPQPKKVPVQHDI